MGLASCLSAVRLDTSCESVGTTAKPQTVRHQQGDRPRKPKTFIRIIMMNENDVIVLLKNIKENGIDVWIDGGWGVDALLGRQTRPHNDIDVFIQRKDRAAFTKMLILNGYRETNMEYTTDDHIVWCDPNNRIVDLHLFEFSEKGTFRYDNEIYSSDILNGQGVIGDIPVRCLTPEAQLLYHQGYEYDEKDVHDVLLLCETFGLSLPEEYKKH